MTSSLIFPSKLKEKETHESVAQWPTAAAPFQTAHRKSQNSLRVNFAMQLFLCLAMQSHVHQVVGC